MNTELKHKLYNITFTLHDLTHKPIPNLYYEMALLHKAFEGKVFLSC